jgi:hypothetical protein
MSPSPKPDDLVDPEQRDCVIEHEDDLDWANVIAVTAADYEVGRVVFDSGDYDTHAAALEAVNAWIDKICEEVVNGVRSNILLDGRS